MTEDQIETLKAQNEALKDQMRKSTGRPENSISLAEMSDAGRDNEAYDPAKDPRRPKKERESLNEASAKAKAKYAKGAGK